MPKRIRRRHGGRSMKHFWRFAPWPLSKQLVTHTIIYLIRDYIQRQQQPPQQQQQQYIRPYIYHPCPYISILPPPFLVRCRPTHRPHHHHQPPPRSSVLPVKRDKIINCRLLSTGAYFGQFYDCLILILFC